MIRILFVDDHPSVMEGIRAMLKDEEDMDVVTSYSGTQALEQIKSQSFDVLLIDLNIPGLNGIDLVKEVLRIEPDAVILIYTGYDVEPHFNILVEAGISGFIPKTASREKLVTSIRCAQNGETVIPTSLFKMLRRQIISETYREGETENFSINQKELIILKYLAQGKSNKEIAETLLTGQRTLEYALTQLFHKLNVKSRKEAVTKSKQLGLLLSEDFV